MRLVITIDHRFDRTPDQQIWTKTSYSYAFWQRYLEVFDQVQVVARVRDVLAVPPDWKVANGFQVNFAAIPYFIGPQQYVLNLHRVRQAARRVFQAQDAVILRGGAGFVGVVEEQLTKTHHPYGVEVLGDPYDVFAPGANAHPLRALFRWQLPRALRQSCKRAAAVSYVTTTALQSRYPCPQKMFGVSDVELPDAAIATQPRLWKTSDPQRTLHLIFVGTLEVHYKGPQILIEALALARKAGLQLRLSLVGDGRLRPEMERLVQQWGLSESVQFLGQLAGGAAVIAALDAADLFVMPSYAEGLPRAMVEAMARGLPCIGSAVGGIPELLSADDCVPVGNATALAAKLQEVVSNPSRMNQMSERNWQRVQGFRDQVLADQRRAFLDCVCEFTEVWVRKNHA